RRRNRTREAVEASTYVDVVEETLARLFLPLSLAPTHTPIPSFFPASCRPEIGRCMGRQLTGSALFADVASVFFPSVNNGNFCRIVGGAWQALFFPARRPFRLLSFLGRCP